MKNPFEITKAEQLNEDNIVNFWANTKDYYKELLVSSKPMYILGAKGSGKTHLLRNFSYHSQKIRAVGNDIINSLKNDEFFSIYISLNDYSLSRFNRVKQLEVDLWNEYFFYYLNLIMIEEFLYTIKNIIHDTNIDESVIYFNDIIEKYLFIDGIDINSCEEFHSLFRKIHKDFDKSISKLNMGMIDKLDESLLLFDTRNNVFYDITYEIIKNIKLLEDIKVVYFIDEFENINEQQQKYINTILRHPKFVDKISLKISGRLYSIKTEETFDANEKLLDGAEIDKKFIGYNSSTANNQSEQSSEIFFIELFNKRVNSRYTKDMLKILFDNNNTNESIDFLLNQKSSDRKYFNKLSKELLKLGFGEILINKVIENLIVENNPLYEKINILYFYRKFRKNNPIEISNFIKLECKNLTSYYKELISHYKSDLIYQILISYNKTIYYSGFDSIVKLSENNPRAFLQIQKNIFKNSSFSGINMILDGSISKDIQNISIREASSWFWENAIIDVDNKTINAIFRLCNFFREYRNYDKISEKTLISFAYNPDEIGNLLNKYINKAINHSLLIKLNGRKSKDGKVILSQVKINPMLAPKWNLSFKVGNSIPLSKNTITALFDDNNDNWDLIVKEIRTKKTFIVDAKKNDLGLFEDMS